MAHRAGGRVSYVQMADVLHGLLVSAIINCQAEQGSIAVPVTGRRHLSRSHCWERHYYAKSKFRLQGENSPVGTGRGALSVSF